MLQQNYKKLQVSINSTSYKGSGYHTFHISMDHHCPLFPLIPLPIKEAVVHNIPGLVGSFKKVSINSTSYKGSGILCLASWDNAKV